MTEADADTERTVVKTYVPAYQKEAWRDHAEQLDMSLSEFVRTMVQAGRRGFGADGAGDAPTASRTSDDGAPAATGDAATPAAAADGGHDIEERVVEALADGDSCSWEDLLAASAPDDLADALDDTLQSLQTDGRIRHSGQTQAYTLTDDER